MFLSCRPFVAITTLSTGLVGVVGFSIKKTLFCKNYVPDEYKELSLSCIFGLYTLLSTLIDTTLSFIMQTTMNKSLKKIP